MNHSKIVADQLFELLVSATAPLPTPATRSELLQALLLLAINFEQNGNGVAADAIRGYAAEVER